MDVRALKKGGPARSPTLPGSRVPRAKIMVTSEHKPSTMSLRVVSRFWRGVIGRADTPRARAVVRRREPSMMKLQLLGLPYQEEGMC